MEEGFAADDVLRLSNQVECATNYFRLVQLTMIEGTNVVRKTILSRLRQRKTLYTVLAEKRSEFVKKGSGFNRQQLDVLYPLNGNVDLAKIDMTLWFALGRKLHVIPKTSFDHVWGEASSPIIDTQVEWCQDLASIHAVRNNLFHLVKPEIENDIFDNQWKEISEALSRLDPSIDPSVDFEKYRTSELNPAAVKEFQAMVREQCLLEKCEELTDEVRRKHRLIRLIIFVVILILLAILLAGLIFALVFKQPRTCDKYVEYRVIGDLGGLYFLPRYGWGAEEPSGKLDQLDVPVPNVVYTHTAEISQCLVTEECCNQVRNIQYLQMHKRQDTFFDIGYHYLIDSKGIIYEGRKPTQIPSAVYRWNWNISSVAFIGNFMYQTPTIESLASFDLLLAFLRLKNYIVANYTIYGMCECRNTESPGKILYNLMRQSELPHIRGHVRTRKETYCFFNRSSETPTTRIEL